MQLFGKLLSTADISQFYLCIDLTEGSKFFIAMKTYEDANLVR